MKGRVGYATVIGDSELFRLGFAKYEALHRAARACVYEVHGEAEAWINTGNDLTEVQNARLRQAVTWVQEVNAVKWAPCFRAAPRLVFRLFVRG